MTKTDLITSLMEKGYTKKRARGIVNIIFSGIKEALERHETVDLPFGSISVRASPRPRRVWSLNRPQTYYQKRYRIWFTPKELLPNVRFPSQRGHVP